MINWRDVFERFGPNIYGIDQGIMKHNSYTLILLTNKIYSNRLLLVTDKALQNFPIQRYYNDNTSESFPNYLFITEYGEGNKNDYMNFR